MAADDLRGNISSEYSHFFSDSAAGWNSSFSVSADVEFYKQLADNVSLTIRPFAREDSKDDSRSHADFREFIIVTNGDSWEFSGGLGQVFWGVTESRNPVDIINQIDNLEGVGSSDKLGQLMLAYKWFNEYGDFELFMLPHFRKRGFSGANGRPNIGFTVQNNPQFESADGKKHIGSAARWSRSFDTWDLGLHYYSGTARAPALIPANTNQTVVELVPRYQQLQQFGVDALGIYGDLQLKAEFIHQSGDEISNHAEAVTGLEYTLVGALSPLQDNAILPEEWCQVGTKNPFILLLCNDRMDIGLVFEYLWDERGTDATQPFQNDLLAGLRFAINDEGSSDALIGLVRDLDYDTTSLSIEASTRIFNSFRLSGELRTFSDSSDDPFFRALAKEDFIRLNLGYYF